MTQWISPKNLPNSIANIPVIDLRGQIPVNPKGGWTDINPPRPVEALTTIVMHHDALSKASTDKYTDEQLIRNIATSHINSTKNRKDGDNFPYHLFIRNGKVYICNDLTALTYGVASNNGYTIHISVSGNYAANDVLNAADRSALYMAYFIAKASMPAYKELKAHKDITATACPGYDMKQVREDVFALEQQIEQNESPAKKEEIAYRMANQILYLQRMSQGKDYDNSEVTEKQKKWALGELLKLEPEFRRLGFLK